MAQGDTGGIRFDTDLGTLRRLTEESRQNPELLASLERDPKAFLGEYGVIVDDATAEAIRSNLGSRRSIPDTLASVTSVHIDL